MNEFYMVIVAQAGIIGALTWINFRIHKRVSTLEYTYVRMAMMAMQTEEEKESGPQLLLD